MMSRSDRRLSAAKRRNAARSFTATRTFSLSSHKQSRSASRRAGRSASVFLRGLAAELASFTKDQRIDATFVSHSASRWIPYFAPICATVRILLLMFSEATRRKEMESKSVLAPCSAGCSSRRMPKMCA
eukprot:scaffold838_cov251-Pinguiococcus_pyrenoidosus.AAC.4